MQAKVLQPFPGVPDGQIYPKNFAEGDVLDGALAQVAVDAGLAEIVSDEANDAVPADVDAMSVEQLKAHASDKGVDLAGATKKADIIAAIVAAEAK